MQKQSPPRNGTEPTRPMPDPEVQPATVRSPRSTAEKIRIVQEYDSYPAGASERGALLRREGLYTSHISKWRKRIARADADAQAQDRKATSLTAENERLRHQVARLQARLAQAETVIDVQKKVAQLLGASLLPALPDEQ